MRAPLVIAAAEALPFPDAHFDAAYLVTVLGEIPSPPAALAYHALFAPCATRP